MSYDFIPDDEQKQEAPAPPETAQPASYAADSSESSYTFVPDSAAQPETQPTASAPAPYQPPVSSDTSGYTFVPDTGSTGNDTGAASSATAPTVASGAGNTASATDPNEDWGSRDWALQNTANRFGSIIPGLQNAARSAVDNFQRGDWGAAARDIAFAGPNALARAGMGAMAGIEALNKTIAQGLGTQADLARQSANQLPEGPLRGIANAAAAAGPFTPFAPAMAASTLAQAALRDGPLGVSRANQAAATSTMADEFGRGKPFSTVTGLPNLDWQIPDNVPVVGGVKGKLPLADAADYATMMLFDPTNLAGMGLVGRGLNVSGKVAEGIAKGLTKEAAEQAALSGVGRFGRALYALDEAPAMPFQALGRLADSKTAGGLLMAGGLAAAGADVFGQQVTDKAGNRIIPSPTEWIAKQLPEEYRDSAGLLLMAGAAIGGAAGWRGLNAATGRFLPAGTGIARAGQVVKDVGGRAVLMEGARQLEDGSFVDKNGKRLTDVREATPAEPYEFPRRVGSMTRQSEGNLAVNSADTILNRMRATVENDQPTFLSAVLNVMDAVGKDANALKNPEALAAAVNDGLRNTGKAGTFSAEAFAGPETAQGLGVLRRAVMNYVEPGPNERGLLGNVLNSIFERKQFTADEAHNALMDMVTKQVQRDLKIPNTEWAQPVRRYLALVDELEINPAAKEALIRNGVKPEDLAKTGETFRAIADGQKVGWIDSGASYRAAEVQANRVLSKAEQAWAAVRPDATGRTPRMPDTLDPKLRGANINPLMDLALTSKAIFAPFQLVFRLGYHNMNLVGDLLRGTVEAGPEFLRTLGEGRRNELKTALGIPETGYTKGGAQAELAYGRQPNERLPVQRGAVRMAFDKLQYAAPGGRLVAGVMGAPGKLGMFAQDKLTKALPIYNETVRRDALYVARTVQRTRTDFIEKTSARLEQQPGYTPRQAALEARAEWNAWVSGTSLKHWSAYVDWEKVPATVRDDLRVLAKNITPDQFATKLDELLANRYDRMITVLDAMPSAVAEKVMRLLPEGVEGTRLPTPDELRARATDAGFEDIFADQTPTEPVTAPARTAPEPTVAANAATEPITQRYPSEVARFESELRDAISKTSMDPAAADIVMPVWDAFVADLARRGAMLDEDAFASVKARFAENFKNDTYATNAQTNQAVRLGDNTIVRGANSVDELGNVVITLFRDANESTIIHESFHTFQRFMDAFPELYETERGALRRVYGDDAEMAARGFERYMREGKAPIPALQAVFDTIKQWMVRVYQSLTNSPIDVPLTNEVRQAFQTILGGPEFAKDTRIRGEFGAESVQQTRWRDVGGSLNRLQDVPPVPKAAVQNVQELVLDRIRRELGLDRSRLLADATNETTLRDAYKAAMDRGDRTAAAKLATAINAYGLVLDQYAVLPLPYPERALSRGPRKTSVVADTNLGRPVAIVPEAKAAEIVSVLQNTGIKAYERAAKEADVWRSIFDEARNAPRPETATPVAKPAAEPEVSPTVPVRNVDNANVRPEPAAVPKTDPVVAKANTRDFNSSAWREFQAPFQDKAARLQGFDSFAAIPDDAIHRSLKLTVGEQARAMAREAITPEQLTEIRRSIAQERAQMTADNAVDDRYRTSEAYKKAYADAYDRTFATFNNVDQAVLEQARVLAANREANIQNIAQQLRAENDRWKRSKAANKPRTAPYEDVAKEAATRVDTEILLATKYVADAMGMTEAEARAWLASGNPVADVAPTVPVARTPEPVAKTEPVSPAVPDPRRLRVPDEQLTTRDVTMGPIRTASDGASVKSALVNGKRFEVVYIGGRTSDRLNSSGKPFPERATRRDMAQDALNQYMASRSKSKPKAEPVVTEPVRPEAAPQTPQTVATTAAKAPKIAIETTKDRFGSTQYRAVSASEGYKSDWVYSRDEARSLYDKEIAGHRAEKTLAATAKSAAEAVFDRPITNEEIAAIVGNRNGLDTTQDGRGIISSSNITTLSGGRLGLDELKRLENATKVGQNRFDAQEVTRLLREEFGGAAKAVQQPVPLAQIKATPANAWAATRTVAGSPYVTDGYAFIKRDAVTTPSGRKMLDTLDQRGGGIQNLSPERAADLWQSVQRASTNEMPATLIGALPGLPKGKIREATTGYAFMRLEDGSIMALDGRRLALLTDIVKPDAYAATSASKALALYKNGDVAAYIMPMFMDKAKVTELAGIVEQGMPQPRTGDGTPFQQDTRLQAEPGRQTDTPEFRNWFGASKVVDETGAPRVVYHGTQADFAAFDPARLGQSTGHPTAELGFFFSESPKVPDLYTAESRMRGVDELRQAGQPVTPGRTPNTSQSWTDARTMPVYLAVERPFVMSVEDFLALGDGAGALKERLMREGYDGIHVVGDAGTAARLGGDEFASGQWIAFDPTQIKSATGNAGTFSRTNPDIRFQSEPRQDPLLQYNAAAAVMSPHVLNVQARQMALADAIGKLPSVVAQNPQGLARLIQEAVADPRFFDGTPIQMAGKINDIFTGEPQVRTLTLKELNDGTPNTQQSVYFGMGGRQSLRQAMLGIAGSDIRVTPQVIQQLRDIVDNYRAYQQTAAAAKAVSDDLMAKMGIDPNRMLTEQQRREVLASIPDPVHPGWVDEAGNPYIGPEPARTATGWADPTGKPLRFTNGMEWAIEGTPPAGNVMRQLKEQAKAKALQAVNEMELPQGLGKGLSPQERQLQRNASVSYGSREGLNDARAALFGYDDRSYGQYVLDHWSPYSYWTMQHMAQAGAWMAEHPFQYFTLMSMMRDWAAANQNEPDSDKFSVYLWTTPDGSEIRLRPGQFFAAAGQGLKEVFDPFSERDDPMAQALSSMLQVFGLSPHVPIDLAMQAATTAGAGPLTEWYTGPKDQNRARTLTTQGALINKVLKANGIDFDPLAGARKAIYGTDPARSGDLARIGIDDYYTGLALAQMVKNKEITTNDARRAIISLRDGKPNEVWMKAERFSSGERARAGLMSYFGLPTSVQTPERQRVDQMSRDLYGQGGPGGKLTVLPREDLRTTAAREQFRKDNPDLTVKEALNDNRNALVSAVAWDEFRTAQDAVTARYRAEQEALDAKANRGEINGKQWLDARSALNKKEADERAALDKQYADRNLKGGNLPGGTGPTSEKFIPTDAAEVKAFQDALKAYRDVPYNSANPGAQTAGRNAVLAKMDPAMREKVLAETYKNETDVERYYRTVIQPLSDKLRAVGEYKGGTPEQQAAWEKVRSVYDAARYAAGGTPASARAALVKAGLARNDREAGQLYSQALDARNPNYAKTRDSEEFAPYRKFYGQTGTSTSSTTTGTTTRGATGGNSGNTGGARTGQGAGQGGAPLSRTDVDQLWEQHKALAASDKRAASQFYYDNFDKLYAFSKNVPQRPDKPPTADQWAARDRLGAIAQEYNRLKATDQKAASAFWAATASERAKLEAIRDGKPVPTNTPQIATRAPVAPIPARSGGGSVRSGGGGGGGGARPATTNNRQPAKPLTVAQAIGPDLTNQLASYYMGGQMPDEARLNDIRSRYSLGVPANAPLSVWLQALKRFILVQQGVAA